MTLLFDPRWANWYERGGFPPFLELPLGFRTKPQRHRHINHLSEADMSFSDCRQPGCLFPTRNEETRRLIKEWSAAIPRSQPDSRVDGLVTHFVNVKVESRYDKLIAQDRIEWTTRVEQRGVDTSAWGWNGEPAWPRYQALLEGRPYTAEQRSIDPRGRVRVV